MLVAGGAFAVVSLFGFTTASAQTDPWSSSPEDWNLTPAISAQATRAIFAFATQTEPDADGRARTAGEWPANVFTARSLGTTRIAANRAMGTPDAAPGDSRPVACAEAQGSFSTATLPRPQGSPVVTYEYAVICFDPTTGEVLDTGLDDRPLNREFASSRAIDVRAALG